MEPLLSQDAENNPAVHKVSLALVVSGRPLSTCTAVCHDVQNLATLTGHTKTVNCVRWASKSQLLASASVRLGTALPCATASFQTSITGGGCWGRCLLLCCTGRACRTTASLCSGYSARRTPDGRSATWSRGRYEQEAPPAHNSRSHRACHPGSGSFSVATLP
jgi:hypothetical protein